MREYSDSATDYGQRTNLQSAIGGAIVSDRTIKDLVQETFGAAAQGYVTSSIHAKGGDLQRLIELARPRGDERLLDVATGGGHTALAFAPHVREDVATDLTPKMLAAAEAFIH